jgi:hypothetical protein
VTVTATGHLPPDNGTNSTQGSLSHTGTQSMKVSQIGSPVSQLNEATTPGRAGQVNNFSFVFFKGY